MARQVTHPTNSLSYQRGACTCVCIAALFTMARKWYWPHTCTYTHIHLHTHTHYNSVLEKAELHVLFCASILAYRVYTYVYKQVTVSVSYERRPGEEEMGIRGEGGQQYMTSERRKDKGRGGVKGHKTAGVRGRWGGKENQ